MKFQYVPVHPYQFRRSTVQHSATLSHRTICAVGVDGA